MSDELTAQSFTQASNPATTSISVRRAVDEALSVRIPGIVETSARLVHRR